MEALIRELIQKAHGFRHIMEAGNRLMSGSGEDIFGKAVALLDDERYQLRMLGTYLLGQLSVNEPAALAILKGKVAADPNWRVQEMLAKAFDYHCRITGYQAALPLIGEWLSGKHPNIPRAVIEGLRIWTARPYFRDHPDRAITLISAHRAAESKYLRKSVGNALRDIRKKHRQLVDAETALWDVANTRVAYVRKLVEK